MKDRYKIKFNPPKLTEEQVNKHKDFEALLVQFEAAPKPAGKVVQLTTRRVAMYASIAAAVLVLVWFGSRMLGVRTITPQQYASPYINPPLEEIDIPTFDFKIRGTEGGIVEDGNGSKIAFPNDAFVDKNGNLVSGDVEIKFKALQDFVDFFIAGIPLTYDTASQQYLLESSGIVEVYAFQNGKPVFLNPNKKIAVELRATIPYNPHEQYHVYKLDTTARNWEYAGIDNITTILSPQLSQQLEEQLAKELPSEVQAYNQQLQAIDKKYDAQILDLENTIPLPAKPVSPRTQEQNSDAFVTRFDFSTADINDAETKAFLEKYDNMLWEILPGQESKIEVLKSGIIWTNTPKLEKMANGRDYQVFLSNKDQQLTLRISPVLLGDEYQNAKADYDAKLAAYTTALNARNNQLVAEKATLNQKRTAEKTALKAQSGKIEQLLEEQRTALMSELLKGELVTVINRFEVDKLGIWNCGYPNQAAGESLEVSFKDESGNDITYNRIYHVNKHQNTLRQLTQNDVKTLPINKEDDQLLWLITSDGRMAVCKPEDFDKIDSDTHTFKPTLIPRKIKNEAELRSILTWE